MLRALYTAASGMTAQQLNLDNIANNLANSSTTGFQQRRLAFSDLLYQNEVAPGSAAIATDDQRRGLAGGPGRTSHHDGDDPDAGRLQTLQVIHWIWRSRAAASSRFCFPMGRRDTLAPAPFTWMHKATWSLATAIPFSPP